MDPVFAAAAEGKMAAIVEERGAELESLLRSKDPEKTGTVSVKVFSECLRALLNGAGSDGGGKGDGEAGGCLGRAERKVLYRRWAVDGEVRGLEELGLPDQKAIYVQCSVSVISLEKEA